MKPIPHAARVALLALALVPGAPASGPTSPPDWTAVASVREVEVLTRNADGSTKETTVWLAVADGQGYVRTGNTSWWKNIERDPDVTLRIEEREHALRAEAVTDETTRQSVEDVFREKYGFFDRLVGWFRSGEPRILRLLPR